MGIPIWIHARIIEGEKILSPSLHFLSRCVPDQILDIMESDMDLGSKAGEKTPLVAIFFKNRLKIFLSNWVFLEERGGGIEPLHLKYFIISFHGRIVL